MNRAIGVNTLIQRQFPAAVIGRVFGTLYGAVGAAAAMSSWPQRTPGNTGPASPSSSRAAQLLCTITGVAVSQHPPPAGDSPA